jgi:hypothetical protein
VISRHSRDLELIADIATANGGVGGDPIALLEAVTRFTGRPNAYTGSRAAGLVTDHPRCAPAYQWGARGPCRLAGLARRTYAAMNDERAVQREVAMPTRHNWIGCGRRGRPVRCGNNRNLCRLATGPHSGNRIGE